MKLYILKKSESIIGYKIMQYSLLLLLVVLVLRIKNPLIYGLIFCAVLYGGYVDKKAYPFEKSIIVLTRKKLSFSGESQLTIKREQIKNIIYHTNNYQDFKNNKKNIVIETSEPGCSTVQIIIDNDEVYAVILRAVDIEKFMRKVKQLGYPVENIKDEFLS